MVPTFGPHALPYFCILQYKHMCPKQIIYDCLWTNLIDSPSVMDLLFNTKIGTIFKAYTTYTFILVNTWAPKKPYHLTKIMLCNAKYRTYKGVHQLIMLFIETQDPNDLTYLLEWDVTIQALDLGWVHSIAYPKPMVSMHAMINFLIWSSIFEWGVVRCRSKNKY